MTSVFCEKLFNLYNVTLSIHISELEKWKKKNESPPHQKKKRSKN